MCDTSTQISRTQPEDYDLLKIINDLQEHLLLHN